MLHPEGSRAPRPPKGGRAAIFGCAALLAALIPAWNPVQAGQTVVTGEFIGCGLGQGVLECRVMGDDGKDYYLSCDVGGAPFAVNMGKAQCDALDEEALAGKTVSFKATLSPDGDVEEAADFAVAPKQPPQSKRRLRRGLVMTGLVKDDENGPIFQTDKGTFELDPGTGLTFGDLADLGEKSAGRKTTLEGDLLRDWDGEVFIVNSVRK